MSTVNNPLATKPFITTTLNNLLSAGGFYLPTQSGFTLTYASSTDIPTTFAPSFPGNTTTTTIFVTISSLTTPITQQQNNAPYINTLSSATSCPLPLGTLICSATSSGAPATSKVGAIIGYYNKQTSAAAFDAFGNCVSGQGFYVVDQAAAFGQTTANLSIPGIGSPISGQTGIATSLTLQSALQTVLNNPIPSSDLVGNIQYYAFMTVLINMLNGANNTYPSTPSTAGASAIRVLACLDDGTPICDTGRCGYTSNNQIVSLINGATLTSGSNYTLAVGNIYQNFRRKLTITGPLYNTSNALATDPSGCIFTLGTAPGNGVNENHQSRPEILLALFSNTGIGYANRWSSTTSSNNIYIAERIGVAPENNQGTIRLNVPSTFTGSIP